MTLLHHHLIDDNTSLRYVLAEIEAHLLGRAEELGKPMPFRNLVAEARLGVSREEQERFFRERLGDVEEATLPFGMGNAQGDGRGIEEAREEVEEGLGKRIREVAGRMGVSAASVCHVAWGQVIGRVSGREDVVYGTVMLGRMQGGEGGERVMGLFINTLPVRMQVGGEGAEASVRKMHEELGELLRYEHASLALAQRCSGVAAPMPLFTGLLNYRHAGKLGRGGEGEGGEEEKAWMGVEVLGGEERTNYPFTLSIDDEGGRFGLVAQVQRPVGARRVCGYMKRALESLVEALEREPRRALRSLEVVPEEEREQLVNGWNQTEREYGKRSACTS